MGPIVAGVVLAAIVWGVYKAATGGFSDARFVIKVGPQAGLDGVSIRGDVGGKPHNEVTEFIAGLALPPGAKIWGVPDGEGLLLRFAGDIPDNVQQRMRNYFMN